MSKASHGACGKSWEQSGNRTSHCGGCHETFVSLSVFDAHRRDSKCLAPEDVKYLKSGLAARADGIWYSPAAVAAAASHFGNDIAGPDSTGMHDHPTAEIQAAGGALSDSAPVDVGDGSVTAEGAAA
jgi:hypothetical protein